MKSFAIILTFLAVLMASCSQKPAENKRRGIDYSQIKPELMLTAEQEQQFDAVVDKYTKIRDASRPAAGEGVKIDRTAMFEKNESITKSQTEEMAAFLTPEQLAVYIDFLKKNSRKRPGHSSDLMAQLKSELALDESQATMLEAINKAFEKSYYDAHDIYHGNAELAREYWFKFDAERKAAVKSVLSEEQYNAYLELSKGDQPVHEAKKD